MVDCPDVVGRVVCTWFGSRVLVDEAATLGVAESKGRLSWGWSLPVRPDWRDKRPARVPAWSRWPASRRRQGGRDLPKRPGRQARGTLMRMAISAPPHMAFANRHGPRSGEAG